MTGLKLYMLIASLVACTFLLRGSFLLFPKTLRLPKALGEALPFVPAAVLAALVSPAVFKLSDLAEPSSLLPKLLAASLALFIAWRSGNILLTLLLGMSSFWLMNWLLR